MAAKASGQKQERACAQALLLNLAKRSSVDNDTVSLEVLVWYRIYLYSRLI